MAVNPFPKSLLQSFLPVPVGGQVTAGIGGTGSTSQGIGSNLYYVNSAAKYAADGTQVGGPNGRNPDQPFKTINFAVTQCVANNGDVIVVGPGHVETIGAAAALAIGVAGVTIVFVGNEVDRGTINFTATAGTVTVTAANVTIIGAMITNSIDALVNGIVVSGADFKMVNCEWRDGSATNSLIQIRTTAAGTRMQLIGYRYFEDQTGGGTQKTEAIRIVGGSYHVLQDCSIQGSFSTGTINNITTAIVSIAFIRCILGNTNAANLCIAILTTSTGYIEASLLSYTATHAITTAHILSADMASGQCIPGATPTVIGHA